MMNQFVESLKRLYQSGKLDKKKVYELFNENKITEEERDFILGSL